MELVYLLCSILSTSFTSFFLSLLLLFRLLLRRLGFRYDAAGAVAGEGEDTVSLYEGTVWHERRRPVHHSFRYPVRYALIDLDRSSKPPSDHFSAHEARRISGTTGPVFLLTIPSSVGYVQNPLSLYYCYDTEGSLQNLKKCIAEVTNTPWGERVSFLFNPNSDVVAKSLHVSPFMDMLGNWTMKTNTPGDNLFVTISVNHPKHGEYFSASLMAKRVSSSTHTDLDLFFWLMPHKVALGIYWQKEHIVNPESAGANLAKDLRSLNLSERSKSPDNSPSRRQPNSEYQGFHFITSNNHCLVPGRCRRRSRSRLLSFGGRVFLSCNIQGTTILDTEKKPYYLMRSFNVVRCLYMRHRTINRLESTVPILQITQLQDIMASLGGMQNGPGANRNAVSV
ncbi:hypothetical protein KY290_025645 [Solanum tuberosum]|uniref:Uncharacterized protein n=1 Tax=Solanum tuberosum TaxID=4113 RepID=A0ABQ7UU60_SOLTU|nr:hypothetical protein KY290_025645 [Solanum tuberosum]